MSSNSDARGDQDEDEKRERKRTIKKRTREYVPAPTTSSSSKERDSKKKEAPRAEREESTKSSNEDDTSRRRAPKRQRTRSDDGNEDRKVETLTFTVPDGDCGAIIGRGGNLINRTRVMSGCQRVRVERDPRNPLERTIILQGTKSQIRRAYDDIQTNLKIGQKERENRGGGGGGGRGGRYDRPPPRHDDPYRGGRGGGGGGYPPRGYDDRGPPPPRGYDDRGPPPPRGYDDRRGPPPREYDDRRGPPPREYDDRRGPSPRERGYDDPRRRRRDDAYARSRGPPPPPGASGGGAAEISKTIMVPSTQIGGLIGRGGSVIKHIRQTSRCNIKVSGQDDMAPGSNERAVVLRGSEQEIAAAERLIAEKLATVDVYSGRDVGGTPQYGGANGVNYFGGGGAPNSSAGGGAVASGPPPGTQQVLMQVTGDVAGRVIGKGGSAITEIRSLSGAHVEVGPKGILPNGLRQITITGNAQQNQMAQYLIGVKMMEGQVM